jgi:hypothetical protein
MTLPSGRGPVPPAMGLSNQDQAFLLFGRAMAAWAKVERAFYAWFEHITLLDMRQAQPLYYAVTNFRSRMDLISAGLAFVKLDCKEEEEFIGKAIKLARNYSSFRNRLAHGEFTIDGLIVEGRTVDRAEARKNAISHEQLRAAANNFQTLADLLWQARDLGLMGEIEDEPDASLSGCIQRLRDLPRRADEACSPE